MYIPMLKVIVKSRNYFLPAVKWGRGNFPGLTFSYAEIGAVVFAVDCYHQ